MELEQPLDLSGKKWRIAKKIKGLKAKPIVTLMVDRTVANSFLINTLEGREPLGDGAVFCIGEAGDAWQQAPEALLKKYDVTSIDPDGWMICTPKPENSVEFFELNGEAWIQGIWGETRGEHVNMQFGSSGDFVCRQRDDHRDVWVVKRKLFLNTYTEL